LNPTRNIDLQLPEGSSTSRRSSYGSDTESRLPSGKMRFYIDVKVIRYCYAPFIAEILKEEVEN